METSAPLLAVLWQDLHHVNIFWQALAVAAAILFAWWVSRLPFSRLLAPGAGPQDADKLRGVRFLVIALLLVLPGRWALAHYQSVSLLHLLVPLLAALLTTRVLYYMLRLIFASGEATRAATRAVSWLVWTGFALHVTGYDADLVSYLDAVAIHVGTHRVSLLLILQSVLSVGAALLLSLWLGRIAEGRVMAAQGVNMNLRVMLTKLMRPALVIVAMLIALPMIGIDLTVLSVFGGAIGVGIGFGLQKIASNYISGFIILLDRSVTIGNFITIDKHSGQLTKMTARYVVIRSADGTEIIVPNETVITSTVLNHSYSDKTMRVPIAVQISYQSDLDTAMRVLVDVAQRHPRALRTPVPKVLISAFADNGISLELGVWVEDPEEGRANLRSDIYKMIWHEFQSLGIEIPYPQREVRLVGGGTAPVAPRPNELTGKISDQETGS